MKGTILQINTSPGGLPKRPVPRAFAGHRGIEGDQWAHPRIHGGPRQAILLITQESIDELRAAAFRVFPGALGENLTTLGLDRRVMRPGQRYRAGEAIIELTKLRQPCKALNVYNPPSASIQKAIYDHHAAEGETSTPVWGLSGFYAKVIQPGLIRPNDIIELSDSAV